MQSIFAELLSILSWSWLNIWFKPMKWLVLGHVTGISSATTTCQPRPANHDLCFLGFWTNQKEIFNASNMHQNDEIRPLLIWTSYFINILDKKIIQNGILSTGWHLNLFQKLLLCLTQVLKAILKMHINA